VYSAYNKDVNRLSTDALSSEQQKSFMQPESSIVMSDSEKFVMATTDSPQQQITQIPTSSNITEITEIGEQTRVKIVVSLPKDDKEAWEKAKRKVDNYLQADTSTK
jgi:hypothetical protein